MIQDVSTAFAPHMEWLHRWFVARGADASTADDLVQLTLIEGWRNFSKLQHEAGMQLWLRAIARHVLHRWWRTISREARFVQMSAHRHPEPVDEIPDNRLPEPLLTIEREDVVALVAQAMDQLPDSTRDLLKARYQDDLPVADLADRTGITPAHMAVRLQRARDQLRTILLQSSGDKLDAYGVDLAAISWRSTRLWCPSCGAARLSMELDARSGIFALKCATCTGRAGEYLYNWRLMDALPHENPLGSARTPGQALQRTTRASAWQVPEIGDRRHCPRCQRHLTCRARVPPSVTDDLGNRQLEMCCPACGFLNASATFGGMALFHPHGMTFWHDHGQIRTRPPFRTTFAQTDAVRVDLVCTTSGRALTFVFSEPGDRLLGVIPDA